MHVGAPPAELAPQAAFTCFDDTHSQTSDPAGAAGPQRIRRRTESSPAETGPHIHITPGVIGEAVSGQRSGGSRQRSAISFQRLAIGHEKSQNKGSREQENKGSRDRGGGAPAELRGHGVISSSCQVANKLGHPAESQYVSCLLTGRAE